MNEFKTILIKTFASTGTSKTWKIKLPALRIQKFHKPPICLYGSFKYFIFPKFPPEKSLNVPCLSQHCGKWEKKSHSLFLQALHHLKRKKTSSFPFSFSNLGRTASADALELYPAVSPCSLVKSYAQYCGKRKMEGYQRARKILSAAASPIGRRH